MTKTSLLQIDEVSPTQSGKSITVNAAIVAIEEACNEGFENLSVGGSNYTVSETNFLRHFVFTFDGVTGDRSILFPDTLGTPPSDTARVFAVRNIDTDSTLTIRGVGTGTTVTLPPSTSVICQKVGVNVVAISPIISALVSTLPYDVGFFVPGVPGASAVVARIIFARPVSFAANFVGSRGTVITNPTSAATFTVEKNGTGIGDFQISTGGVFTFTLSGGASFAAGDILEVNAPVSTDLEDLSVTFLGTRTG